MVYQRQKDEVRPATPPHRFSLRSFHRLLDRYVIVDVDTYMSTSRDIMTGVVRYHGIRPTKRPNTVFVANHTTVFDIVVLSNDFQYSFVGQKHPGAIGEFWEFSLIFLVHFCQMKLKFLGFVQDYILGCLGCLWFDRKDAEDRAKIARLYVIFTIYNSLFLLF